MKAKAWGAVVMVALAWILWSKISSGRIETWSPEDGLNSKEDCEKFGERCVGKIISKDKKLERLSPKSYVEVTKRRKTIVSMHCFPSDFDPRPRK